MIVTEDGVSSEAFEIGTGWALKREGACRGEVCVPLPDGAVVAGRVDLEVVTGRLRMPVVTDPASGAVAVGPAVLAGAALASAEMPELELPDFDGRPFRLSSLRGQKVVLVAWAPY